MEELNFNKVIELCGINIVDFNNKKKQCLFNMELSEKPLDELHQSRYYEDIKLFSHFYYTMINSEYFLSVENICRHLDITRKTFNLDVDPLLDRMVLPCKDELDTKSYIKNYVYENYYLDSYGNNFKYVESVEMADKLRKKVLYSSNSYKKYLEKHMSVDDAKVRVPVFVPKSIVNTLLEKNPKKDKSMIIYELFNKYVESEKDKILECKEKFIMNYDMMIDTAYNTKYKETIRTKEGMTTLEEKKDLSTFKSINSLKVIFGYFYELEVMRDVEYMSSYYLSFSYRINLEKNKKPSRRLVLTKAFMSEMFKLSLDETYKYHKSRKFVSDIPDRTDYYSSYVMIDQSYVAIEHKNYDNLRNSFLKFIG